MRLFVFAVLLVVTSLTNAQPRTSSRSAYWLEVNQFTPHTSLSPFHTP